MLFLLLWPPNKLYTHLNWALLFCLICNTPIENRGLSINLRPFCTSWQWKKLVKNWHMHDGLQLLAAILARWRHLVASNKALNLLHWAMCAVTYQRIAMAIKTASILGVFVDCCLFVCCPGGHWGNTERVVAQCWHPVASWVALDMPHWTMPSVLLRHTAVAIEMAGGQGAFVRHCQFCHQQ